MHHTTRGDHTPHSVIVVYIYVFTLNAIKPQKGTNILILYITIFCKLVSCNRYYQKVARVRSNPGRRLPAHHLGRLAPEHVRVVGVVLLREHPAHLLGGQQITTRISARRHKITMF